MEYGLFVKHCKVEVYLLELKLCENSDPSNMLSCHFSKADTIGEQPAAPGPLNRGRSFVADGGAGVPSSGIFPGHSGGGDWSPPGAAPQDVLAGARPESSSRGQQACPCPSGVWGKD